MKTSKKVGKFIKVILFFMLVFAYCCAIGLIRFEKVVISDEDYIVHNGFQNSSIAKGMVKEAFEDVLYTEEARQFFIDNGWRIKLISSNDKSEIKGDQVAIINYKTKLITYKINSIDYYSLRHELLHYVNEIHNKYINDESDYEEELYNEECGAMKEFVEDRREWLTTAYTMYMLKDCPEAAPKTSNHIQKIIEEVNEYDETVYDNSTIKWCLYDYKLWITYRVKK